jgi:hypothetical protein
MTVFQRMCGRDPMPYQEIDQRVNTYAHFEDMRRQAQK